METDKLFVKTKPQFHEGSIPSRLTQICIRVRGARLAYPNLLPLALMADLNCMF